MCLQPLALHRQFAGSGTTGSAALEEGMRCLLIEREAEYADDIRRRLSISDIGFI